MTTTRTKTNASTKKASAKTTRVKTTRAKTTSAKTTRAKKPIAKATSASAGQAPSMLAAMPTPVRRVEADALTIASWNVNGLRAVAKKGFATFLERFRPDVLGVQEVRAHEDDLDDTLKAPLDYRTHFVAAEKKGYSGVGVYSRVPFERVTTTLRDEAFDVEARYQSIELGALRVVNCYFPNGNGRLRDNSRIPYKLRFYERVFDELELELLGGRPILVMGDFNTAHEEIDLARPRENVATSGFTPIERDELARWLSRGFVDTFRHFVKDGGHYSWWSQRFGVRERNVGWRIDYVLASPGAVPFLRDAFIWRDVPGSDHCPVGVVVDQRILAG